VTRHNEVDGEEMKGDEVQQYTKLREQNTKFRTSFLIQCLSGSEGW
jgi:hypothetical protein